MALEKHFVKHLENDRHGLVDLSNVVNYRVNRKIPFDEFKGIVAEDFKIPKHLQRYWSWVQRATKKIRVDKPLEEVDTELNMMMDLRHIKDKQLTEYHEKNALLTTPLFLETSSGDALHEKQASELLIFVKRYNPKDNALTYVGHIFAESSAQFATIFQQARDLAGIPAETEIIGFEEVQYDPNVVLKELKSDATPANVGSLLNHYVRNCFAA